jgi:hypothetical protein
VIPLSKTLTVLYRSSTRIAGSIPAPDLSEQPRPSILFVPCTYKLCDGYFSPSKESYHMYKRFTLRIEGVQWA